MGTGALSKNTIIYLVGNILNRLGAFLLLPLYTNYLSVGDYGSLEIIYTINSVLSLLFGAGLAHATLRFYFDKEESQYRASVITTNMTVSFLLAVAGCSFVALFSEPISFWLFERNYQEVVLLALVVIVFELNNEVMLAYLRALEKASLFVVLSLIRLVVQVGVSIYLVGVLEMGVLGVLIANLASIFSIWLFLLLFTVSRIGYHIDASIVKPILVYSIPFAGSGILGSLIATSDKILLKEFIGVDEVGIYALASKFALLISFLVMEPFSRGYGPYRFKIMNEEHAPALNARIALYLVIIAMLVALGISLFTPMVLSVMSNSEYFAAGNVVPLITLGFLVLGLNYVFQTGILVKKLTKKVFKISLVSSASTLIFYIVLIPKYGAHGAALGFFLSNLVLAALTLYSSQKVYPIPFKLPRMVLNLGIGAGVFLLDYQYQPAEFMVELAWHILIIVIFIVLVIVVNKEVRDGLCFLKEKLQQRKRSRAL